MRIDRHTELPSTSTYMREHAVLYTHGDVVVTHEQTAGRGQRGNSWEAAPGLNLTFSIMLHPRAIAPAQAFMLSMIVAIATARTVSRYIGGTVTLKWPNDIYVSDRKIAGILIENTFGAAGFERAVVGIGLNVNQRAFYSDAPNPVSMTQLTGITYDLDTILADLAAAIVNDLDTFNPEQADALVADYNSRLWRREGIYTWRDTATGEYIHAAIACVEPTGHLILDTDPPRRYAFKEVAAVL